ncbi:hypothetical protein M1563_03370 [Patescibacteria group bacterium]|nr:hypothetical protein [Patescibacteria group bacterium]MCL5409555.1 hypothetical protein [Patescibacteria group bacterium]
MDTKQSFHYFRKMINGRGIIQFSQGDQKHHRFGYAIEDQARALILACLVDHKSLSKKLAKITISAINPQSGVRCLTYAKLAKNGKYDHFKEASAETVWGLARYSYKYHKKTPTKLINPLIVGLQKSKYTRVWAYTLLGTVQLGNLEASTYFANKLIQAFKKNSSDQWPWYEHFLSYANALLPYSLLAAYQLTKNKQYLEVALKSLDFLVQKTIINGTPIAVGNKGWWTKNGSMPLYDQQPIDISYKVLSLCLAYEVTHLPKYLDQAKLYFSWFEGNNLLHQPVIRADGGCADGLQENRLNKNAGAESIICYLLAATTLSNLLAS